jgi:hypothetical protein
MGYVLRTELDWWAFAWLDKTVNVTLFAAVCSKPSCLPHNLIACATQFSHGLTAAAWSTLSQPYNSNLDASFLQLPFSQPAGTTWLNLHVIHSIKKGPLHKSTAR